MLGTVLPFGNKGDEAIYRTSIKLVREKYPNCKLSLAPSGFQTESPKLLQFQGLVDEILPHPITFINAAFGRFFDVRSSNKLFLRFLKFCSYNSSPYIPALVKYIRTSKIDFISKYENTDLFIVLGHPLERVGLPTYLASYFFPKMILKKKTVAFPLSFSLLKYSKLEIIDKMIRNYIRMLLGKIDVVLFREKRSMEYFLKDMHANTNVLLSADTAFLLENSNSSSLLDKLAEQNVSFEKPSVAVCLRTDYFTAYREEFGDKEAIFFLRGIASLLDNLIEKKSLNVFFVPMMPEGDYAVSKYVHNLLRNRKKAHIIDTKHMDCTDVKTLLSHMDFLITMRIHAAILAGSSNVPSVSILPSHDLKSVGIMEDLSLSNYFLNLSELNSMVRLLPSKVEQLYENIDEVVDDMKERTPIIRSRAERSARILEYLL